MKRLIGHILLDALVPIDHALLIDAMSKRHPGIQVRAHTGPAGGALPNHAAILRVDDEAVVVMSMPMPLPKEEWERPTLRASSTWPQAQPTISRHKGHIVVSTLGEPTHRFESARRLAAVIGCLIAITPSATAVVWEALVVRQSEFWLEASLDAFAPYPAFPYPLWISLHPFVENEKIGVISFGASSFAEREIELEPQAAPAEAVVQKAAGLAVYLLQNGPVLEDGDTFGATESERFFIRRTTSKRVPGLSVLNASPA